LAACHDLDLESGLHDYLAVCDSELGYAIKMSFIVFGVSHTLGR